MDGNKENLMICAVDTNGDVNISSFDGNSVLHERDHFAFIENVLYPYEYFSAIQVLDKKQYEELIGDLE